MIAIPSFNHSPGIPDSRLQLRSVQRTRSFSDTQNSVSGSIQQAPAVPAQIDLVNQLPQDQVREVTDIFRSINILANQALELGHNFENRENLQVQADEDISAIRSVLDEFTQDDLTLFIAIFQNQIPGGLVDSESPGNLISGLSFNAISDNSVESLLNIDVLSEIGALTALDLTDSIIDMFTGNNDSNILESLLDNLTSSLINTAIFENSEQNQEPQRAVTSLDSESSQGIDTAEPVISLQFINPPESNPGTIIDFSG